MAGKKKNHFFILLLIAIFLRLSTHAWGIFCHVRRVISSRFFFFLVATCHRAIKSLFGPFPFTYRVLCRIASWGPLFSSSWPLLVRRLPDSPSRPCCARSFGPPGARTLPVWIVASSRLRPPIAASAHPAAWRGHPDLGTTSPGPATPPPPPPRAQHHTNADDDPGRHPGIGRPRRGTRARDGRHRGSGRDGRCRRTR